MENKTAMQQLKEKIQVVIGEMNGELSSYESGYKQCLINIQNDIDLQMMAMEKEQIVNACNLQRNDYRGMPTYNKSGEQYYNETYVHDTHRTHQQFWCQVMDQYSDKYQKKQNNGNTQ